MGGLNEQIGEFAIYCKKSYTPDTCSCYGSILGQLLRYITSNGGEFNAKVVESWLTGKLESGGSKQLYNCYLTTVRSFDNWRLRKYGLQSDVKSILKLRKRRTPPRILSEEEFEFALSCCEESIDKHILLFLANSGLRREEFRQLRWQDISEDLQWIIVRNGKGSKYRKVPINNTIREILDHYKRGRDDERLPISLRYPGREGPSTLCKRISDGNGMKRFGSHSLRSLLATRLIKHDVSIAKVQKILGHAKLSTTELYLHLCDDDIKGSTDVLD